MKILYCASSASHIDNFHVPYIEEYKKKNYEVHVCASGQLFCSIVDKYYELPFIKKNISLTNLATVLKLSSIIRREKYDIVFTQATLAGLLGRAAAILSFSDSKIVHVCHGYLFDDDGSKKSKLMIMPERLLAPFTSRLVVMNSDDLQIAEKYKLAKHIDFIDGMGLVCKQFPPISLEKRCNIRRALGIADNDIIYVNIGEFSQRKNQAMMIRSFAMLNCENAWLILIGFGEELDNCRILVEELGLSERVIFAYRSCSINEFLRISDIFVTTSIYEGLPFCVEEALFCGLPIVASKIKGHKDLVNAENGILFELADDEALTNAMQEALLLRNNKITLPKKYTSESIIKNINIFGF